MNSYHINLQNHLALNLLVVLHGNHNWDDFSICGRGERCLLQEYCSQPSICLLVKLSLLVCWIHQHSTTDWGT